MLPFANLTGDPALDYVGEGLAEELIHTLARRPGLQVPARTSTFAYRGTPVDVRRVAHDLGVTHVIEGSVRGGGERLHVTVQLIDAQSGFHVWSQAYERDFRDVFAFQQELAAAVLQHLGPGVQASGTAGLESAPPTRNIEAYRLYLQANAIAGASRANLQSALQLYDEALKLDPAFARALAASANTRAVLLGFGFAAPGVIDAAEQDARRAVELDPGSAGAHAALGGIHMARGRWLDAEREFTRATELDPRDASLLNNQGLALLSLGHLRRARELSEVALRLAPLAVPSVMRQALLESLTGNDEEALRLVSLGVSLGAPADTAGVIMLSQAAARAGRPTEAAEYMLRLTQETARSAGAREVFEAAWTAYLQRNRRPAAAAAVREFAARVPLESYDRRGGTLLLTLHVLTGDLDAAYATANRTLDAYEAAGYAGIAWWALWTTMYADFRADPRFAAFVARMRMPDYWNVHGPPDACELVQQRLICSR